MTWKLFMHPGEGAGAPPEPTTEDESNTRETTEAPPEPVARLQAEVEALRKEREDWKDRFLRKAAELDNFRKRTEREKSEAVLFAKSSVLLELLPILDACDRALASLAEAPENEESIERYREGVELLYKQLGDALTRLGVTPIRALGEKFDPRLHEAVSRELNPDYPENTVIEVLRRGYLYNDRLLRPAQVKVAIPPPGH